MRKLPKIEDINQRSQELEILDETSFSLDVIDEIYENINRVNKWLGGDAATLSAIKKEVQGRSHVKIVDIGSGGGGMCRKVSNLLTKMNVSHQVVGIDISNESLQIARNRSADYPYVKFEKIDIFGEEFQKMEADIIISTLTFHHLSDNQITDVLENCLFNKEVVVIINDLHRSKLAFYLFRLISYVFSLHIINRYDGLISILRSFTRSDLQTFETKLTHKHPALVSDISWKWAFRWLWIIKKV